MITLSFAVFLAAFTLVGLASLFKSRGTKHDYYLADGTIAPWLVGLSAVATNNSGYMFIGVIGYTYATGLAASNQPIGIVTALDGGDSEVAPTTAETFAVADLYKVEEALPARYRQRAVWVANKAIFNDVRQFGTADSHALWERLGAGQPAQLLGYNTYEASAMDDGFDAAATADNFILILGDFSNYYIIDRVGMSVELIPHLFATANNLPSGRRGLFAYWRVGADSVNDGGFRMLNIATTA